MLDPRKKTTRIFGRDEVIQSENNDIIEESHAQNHGEDEASLDDIFEDLGL